MRNFPKLIFSLNFLYVLLIAAQIAAIIFLCLYLPSFMSAAAVFIGVWLISAAAACVLLSRRGAPEIKCAWFALIAALPVAGALIYFLSSAGKKPSGLLRTEGNAPSGGLARQAYISCGTTEVGYERAEYFEDGARLFEVMFEEIIKAQKSVYLEFFIIARGEIFDRLTAALSQAKKNGAEIKIIFDGIGSAFKLRRRHIRALKELGEVKIFHKLTPVARARLNFRDHRKIVTVDGKVAFTGGINLADEYANISSPFGYWKDTGVALYGAAAKVFEGMFLSVWKGSYEMKAPESGGEKRCLPYYDSPPHKSFCEDAYARAINCAERKIYAFTPYFCGSEKLISALKCAAERGVDVKFIIPHVPDKKYAFEVTKTYARELTGYGAKFYEFTPGFMHAKSMICDGSAFIGSYNFDYRSTHFNFECGVMFGEDVAAEIERDFMQCLALSTLFEEKKISAYKRFKRFLLKFFSPLV